MAPDHPWYRIRRNRTDQSWHPYVSLAVLFQIVTLPVDTNASHRAVALLDSIGILEGREVGQTRQVLNAAALTYVAAAAASLLQLLRLMLLFGNRRRND